MGGSFFFGQNPKSIDILAYMYVNLYLGPPLVQVRNTRTEDIDQSNYNDSSYIIDFGNFPNWPIKNANWNLPVTLGKV